MVYDVIHIQKEVSIPFDIIVPRRKDLIISKTTKKNVSYPTHDGIKKNRIYKPIETKIVQDILNLYKPDNNLLIVDYNTNYYFSFMCAVQKFNVLYINPNQRYNKFLDMTKIMNNVSFTNFNTRFKVNKIVKTKFVPLLIVNDTIDILNSKRILRKKLHNILIIRDRIEDTLDVYNDILKLGFKLYQIKKNLEFISDIKTFIEEDSESSILAVSTGSKYKMYATVFFD
tara:strand:+ start:514 stop:1197 length:684 start_codon:yes stop_codon:yes gene_type:complete